VNYSRNTINQASDLKNDLESMKLNRKEVTTISLDIEAMYPSITFNMVRKAIEFFAKKLNDEQKIIIKDCLKMIGFGMGNTLITFKDKYYEYGGSTNIEERGLTIGGYESAWLADLVASFLLENSQDLFEQTSKYHGIYRDDGIIFF